MSDPARRIVAVVPAYDEEGAIAGVVDEIHAFDPAIDVVVVDDGSTDGTAAAAAARRRGRRPAARSTSASAPPCRPGSATRSSTATTSPCGSTATASTTRPSCRSCSSRSSGTRRTSSPARASATSDGEYVPPLGRRLGITWFARLVSLLSGQRVTDTTSGFQALNQRAIALFARDYPSDYPEVEATVLLLKHRLRLVEVPVRDARARARLVVDHVLRSVYYAFKVTLALLVAMARRYAVPSEEVHR